MTDEITPPPPKRRRIVETNGMVPPSPSESDITLYSWNVNGIGPFIQPSITSFFRSKVDGTEHNDIATASLRDFLRRHDWPTLLFLQEVKINADDTATINAVKAAVRPQISSKDDGPDYNASFCLPTDRYNARGFGRKVNGVCSIIRKDFYNEWVDTVRPVAWDAEGRFLCIETKAIAHVPKLAIFNVYAVNGTDNDYRDPQTGVVVGSRHDRKLQVHTLLQAECQRLEDQGFAVVLAGDMNVARTRLDGYPNLRTFPPQHCVNRADFEARFFSSDSAEKSETRSADESREPVKGLGMIDTFRALHPKRKGYTYYGRTKVFGESCDRVDLIMTSRALKPALRDAGMHETPADRGPSDHIPLYARLVFDRG